MTLVMQNDVGNVMSDTTVIACITAQPKNNMPTHVKVKNGDGVQKDSTILFEQIRTVDKSRLIKKIGVLPAKYRNDCIIANHISTF